MRVPLALLLVAISAGPALAQDEAMAPPQAADQSGQADPAPDPSPDPSPPADNAGSMDQSTQSSGSYHSETHSSSSSVSVEMADPSQGRRQDDGDRGDYGPEAFAGRWQLATADGSSQCGITLKTAKWSRDTLLASLPAGCPGSLFTANNWRISGGRLELNAGSGDLMASFRQVGPNRWRGSVTATGDAIFLSR